MHFYQKEFKIRGGNLCKRLIEKSVQNCYNGISSKWEKYYALRARLTANLKGEMFMKLKKLLAAVTAAALAITTMAVTSFTASAASFTPYILLNVNSQDWGINGAWVAADKTEITAGQTEYEFTYTAGKDDTWDGDKAQITAYCYSPIDNLKNVSIKSVSINGVDKGISASAGAFNEYTWDQLQSTTVPGYAITVDSATVKGLGAVSSGDVFKLVVTATIDESAKSIGSSNFTCSKAAGELAVGESFTISYDSTNTPDTAQWLVKCAFDADFADHGITNRWPQLVNADGSVDNSAAADTGLEVAKTAEGVYTFTAVNASKAGYVINVEASAAGDWSDTQYLGQGGGNWSVAAEADPTTPSVTLAPKTANVAAEATTELTVTKANADDYTFAVTSSDAAVATASLSEDGTKVTVTGVAAGTATITVTGTKADAESITATCAVTVTDGTQEPDDPNPPSGTTTGSYTGSNIPDTPKPILPITITPGSGKTLADIRSITVAVSFSEGSWGGGCVGMNVDGTWTSAEWANGTAETVTIQTPNGVSEDNSCQFQVWWLGHGDNDGDGTVYYSVSYTYSDGSSSGNTPGGDTPGGDTPVTPPVVSGNSVIMGSTEFNGWYEAVLTKDQLFGSNTGATTITFTGADLSKVGYNSVSAGGYKGIDCTGTVTIQINDIDLSDNFFLHVGGNAATVVTWSFNGGSSGGNEPSNPTDPSNPSAPSYGSTYEPPIPSGATSISMVDTIISTGAASVSFNLGSNAKLDKEVFEALASKGDITVRFNVAGGAYWEIGGANITAAKAVDLGVRMNSTLIPASAVSELAGDKTTIQLSLKHNGDFGFTGVLNVPVGKANNGKFANLYYYHSGKFDFVGSSAISNGRAKFAFSHASNYLIVIDDYAYGEDVSSAAGMTETTETSAVPYVAALVVVSAFAASAVVLKKRLSK